MRQLIVIVCVLCLAACADDEASELSGGSNGSSGTGGAMGFTPPPNGVHIAEADACTQLRDALQARLMARSCTTTLRLCPGFLRSQYDPDCAEFDQGSIEGCIAHIDTLLDCAELTQDVCVLTNYPGTEPAQCP